MLEVGSYDVHGCTRSFVEGLGPESYVGIDIRKRPSVDQVCDITELVSQFGEGAFDVVLTTAVLEHVERWREALDYMKRVLRPNTQWLGPY